MPPRFQAPRGTRDLLPAEAATFRALEDNARRLAALYGYQPIETPMFEDSGVFERGVGEVTDIVEKELFRIRTPGGDQDRWALRPEPTAGICRAYVEHGMHTLPQPVKLTMFGPMFRYDRPQAGRYRQFWQYDVEAIGDAGPAIDAEIIQLAWRFLTEAGVENLELHLNSIGDANCRPRYLHAFVEYMSRFVTELPELDRHRLEANPLRVLDTKAAPTLARIADAPRLADFLCDACKEHWEGLLEHLASLGVPVTPAPLLVRGLDYYTRTAFEFYQRGGHGQQSALGGGGRYDGLIELFGAKPTPGIGFGLGVDRIALLASGEAGKSEGNAAHPVAIVVGADPAATAARLKLATELRAAGVPASADLGQRTLSRQLERAAREGAHFAVVVGDELTQGEVQLRDLEAGTQKLTKVTDLPRELQRAHGSHRHG
ncbi:MAG TPA: histidine--tRNA ligase [Candidatus Limnocylindrales bacterium]|jgi:histidyl-tRNA synthetase